VVSQSQLRTLIRNGAISGLAVPLRQRYRNNNSSLRRSVGRSGCAQGVAKVDPTTTHAKPMCDDDTVRESWWHNFPRSKGRFESRRGHTAACPARGVWTRCT